MIKTETENQTMGRFREHWHSGFLIHSKPGSGIRPARHKGRSFKAKSDALCNQKLVQLGNVGVTVRAL
jgi:hypothetical protein